MNPKLNYLFVITLVEPDFLSISFPISNTDSTFLLLPQNYNDDENFIKLLNVMTLSWNGKAIGVFDDDDLPGEFCESWRNTMAAYDFRTTDIGASIADVMAVKEECELTAIKEACYISVNVFEKYLKPYILEIKDASKVSCINELIYFAIRIKRVLTYSVIMQFFVVI